MSDPSLIGGRYRLERLLGEGGMGRVHAATDTRLGRRVAVKVLAAGRTSTRSARRLEREAILAARVHHPNVVAIFDAGHHEGSPYLVMELVEGTNAADLLAADGPLPVERAVDLAGQVLDGLAAMHELDLVHRDITPANILLADGVAKLADLGIASDPDDAELALTRPGELLGTAAYLAPERVTGEPATARSDLYAVAAVVYELLSGSPPHARGDAGATALAHLLDDAPPLSEAAPGVPPAVAAAVDAGLAREPADRPADARDFAGRLRAGLDRVPAGVGDAPAAMAGGPDGPAHRTTTTLAVAAFDTAPLPIAAPPQSRRRRRTALVFGAIVVGGVLAGGAAAMLLRDDADGVAAVAAGTVPSTVAPTSTAAPTTTVPPTTTTTTTTVPSTTTTAPPPTSTTLPEDLDGLVELVEEDPDRWGQRARVLLDKLEDRDDFDERDLDRVERDVERWLDRDRLDTALGAAVLDALDEARRDLPDDEDDDD